MKTQMSSRRGAEDNRRGIMLIDCLVYVAVFFVVTGSAYSVFYRTFESSRLITRAAVSFKPEA